MHFWSTTRLALSAYLLCLTPGIQAHEFWFTPVAAVPAIGDAVTLRLEVGEFFNGEAAGFSIPTTQALRHFTANVQPHDLRPSLPAEDREAEVALTLDTPGIHLLAYDSAPQYITLESNKFNAYLHDEGLDFIKAQREKSGTDNRPARERYRRHIKTLVQVGNNAVARQAPDATYATSAGQRLEIMPLNNPLTLGPSETLSLKIVFDATPLSGALVKAWHKHRGQLLMIRATTSVQGVVSFNLPYPGDWMISVVHMVPATDDLLADWESLWGNLSFQVSP